MRISSGDDSMSDGVLAQDVIGLLFEVVQVALLIHPQSREYQRIWFE